MSSVLKDFRPGSLCLLKESQISYWQYSRKPRDDILQYTEKSSIYETPSKVKFKEGSDVLVRWTDGLLYLGNIIKVEEEFSRCAVKFEDGSQYWALYKDIYKGPSISGDIFCTVCDSGASHPPDEIVICDKCSLGYHQLCHIPKIDSSVLKPEVSWICRKCVFASTAKKGGAVKKGPNAQIMYTMKKTLPYNIDSLTWDVPHRSNLQQIYCYCGGPGEWYMKMLQCARCKQWFHEACLQCLDEPILFGDRFYIFVCSVCNQGPEFLRRIALRWPDVAHLVLFNLTILHGKIYFDLESLMMSFLKENWSQFYLKDEELCSSWESRKRKMAEVLQNNKSRFKSGKEVKRKTALWGLRSRVPPSVPAIIVPELGPITDDVLNSFKATGRKSKFLVKSDSVPVPVKRNRKPPQLPPPLLPPPPPPPSSTVIEIPKQKSAIQNNRNNDDKHKKAHSKMSRRKLRTSGARKFTRSSASISELSDSEDTSSSQGTLNSIIPHPNNFEGLNNPFSTSEKPSSCKLYSSASTNRTSNCTKSRRSRVTRHQRNMLNNKSPSFINKLIGSCNLNNDNRSEIFNEQSFNAAIAAAKLNVKDLNSSVNSYFGAENRIANGEKYKVLAKRKTPEGKTQYLIEWESVPS